MVKLFCIQNFKSFPWNSLATTDRYPPSGSQIIYLNPAVWPYSNATSPSCMDRMEWMFVVVLKLALLRRLVAFLTVSNSCLYYVTLLWLHDITSVIPIECTCIQLLANSCTTLDLFGMHWCPVE